MSEHVAEVAGSAGSEKQVSPEEVGPEDLNNFHALLPGGSLRSRLPYLADDQQPREGETIRAWRERLGTGDEIEGESSKKLDKPLGVLFANIDRVLQANRIDPEEIEVEVGRINRLADAGLENLAELVVAVESLYSRVLPAYRQLREKGYTHADLTKGV